MAESNVKPWMPEAEQDAVARIALALVKAGDGLHNDFLAILSSYKAAVERHDHSANAEVEAVARELDDVAVWAKLAADETHERSAAGNFLSIRDRMTQLAARLRALPNGGDRG